MNDKLFIAEKVKVGFNLRSDTYQGKLGYVIGFDGKKWRKEPSWESWRVKYMESDEYKVKKQKCYDDEVAKQTKQYQWYIAEIEKNTSKYSNDHYYRDYIKNGLEGYLKRYVGDYKKYNPNLGNVSDDKSIIPIEFDNVPTEGFVLNKKAGGYSSGWNHRSTYCRVYDPRGFEFEISIPNLLFILQECNSMKGKGLEGEFVYAWDGKDLVLLPTSSEDYVQSTHFTKLQSGKVTVKDLVEGCTYKTKDMTEYVYLGKFNWFEEGTDYTTNKEYIDCKKQHVFYNKKLYSKFLGTSSLSNFVQKVSDVPVDNYADLLDLYNKSMFSGVLLDTTLEDVLLPTKYKSYYSSRRENEIIATCLLEISDNKFEIYNVTAEVDYSDRTNYGSYNHEFKYMNYSFKGVKVVTLKDNGDFEVKSMKPKIISDILPKDLSNMNFKQLVMNKNKKIKLINF